MKKLLPKSVKIWDVISYGFDIFFGKFLFMVVPFLVLGILFGVFSGLFEQWIGGMNDINFWLNFNWSSLGIYLVKLWLISLIFTFVIFSFFDYSSEKKLVFSDLITRSFKRFWGVAILGTIENILLVIPFVVFFALSSSNQLLAVIVFVLLFLIWLFLTGKLILICYLFLDKKLSLGQSFVESFVFTKKIWRWILVWKMFMILWVIVLLWWGLSFITGIITVVWTGFGWNMVLFTSIISGLTSAILFWFLNVFISSLYISYREKFKNPEINKENLGCFFYGCWIGMWILVLNILVIVVLSVLGINWIMNNLTTDKYIPVPAKEYSLQEQTDAISLFENIEKSLTDMTDWKFVITESMINSMIQSVTGENNEKILKDYLYVSIEGNSLFTQFSIPLDFVPYDKLSNRYINWKIWWEIYTDDELFDKIQLYVFTGTINGKTASDEFMSGFNHQSLLKNIYMENNEITDLIRRIKYLELSWGNIVMELMPK